jgi:hypothetical protein
MELFSENPIQSFRLIFIIYTISKQVAFILLELYFQKIEYYNILL